MIEVYKYLPGLSPALITDIFTLWKNHYNIHNIRNMRFGVDEISFRVSQL